MPWKSSARFTGHRCTPRCCGAVTRLPTRRTSRKASLPTFCTVPASQPLILPRGKFRTFLLTALQNFLADHHDRQRTIKRGGEFRLLALSGTLVQSEPDAFVDPTGAASAADSLDRVFDQQWAVALVKRALAHLGEELAEEGKGKLFAALQPMLGLNEQPLSRQEEVARNLRMPLATLRTHLHRLRLRFRSILRAEVACTVAQPGDVEAELRHLFQILLDC